MHYLLIKLYKHNSLCLNGDKTEYINFTNETEKAAKFTIGDEQGNIIEQKEIIKILGYRINKQNNLDNHISRLIG